MWDRTTNVTTTKRGYGYKHAMARRIAADKHHPSDPCTICHLPLGEMSSDLHYDHQPDRDGYRGFAHAGCNRTDGARRGSARAHANARAIAVGKPPRRQSRDW
jgi:hypothetical protein